MAVPSTPPQSSDSADRPGSAQPSPSLSDDSALEMPEFPYFTNSQGEFVRMKTPSPDHSPSPANSRRASLSRSESAPAIADPIPQLPTSTTIARQFTRVASGPAIPMATPTTTSTYFPRSSGLSSTARKFSTAARRVVRTEDRENAGRELAKENNDAMPFNSTSTNARPLADVVPVPQRTLGANGRQVLPVPSRFRSMKKVETIAEVSDGTCLATISARSAKDFSRAGAGSTTGIITCFDRHSAATLS